MEGSILKKLILFSVVVVCASVFLVTCNTNSGTAPEFVGTWTLTGALTETCAFTASTLTATDSGTLNGVMNFSFQAVDEGAKHIKMSFTSGTGNFAALPIGTVAYLTYSVSGNSLYQSMGQTVYPASAATGPYIRQ
jgi:hypothetical protein